MRNKLKHVLTLCISLAVATAALPALAAPAVVPTTTKTTAPAGGQLLPQNPTTGIQAQGVNASNIAPAFADPTVPVTVSASQSTVAASATSVVADGVTTATITVTLKDASNNPVSAKKVALSPSSGGSTVTAVSTTTDPSGLATFTVADKAAETVSYTAIDTTDNVTVAQPVKVTFTAGAVSATQSTVAASTATVAADGVTTATIKVTLKDAYNNPVSGKNVALNSSSTKSAVTAVSATTDPSGLATFTVKDTAAEAVTYTAVDTVDNNLIVGTVQVAFTVGAVSATQSTVMASPTSVVADGATTAKVTVTLKGATGNPVSNKNVVLTSGLNNSTVTAVSATTNATGQATFNVKDTAAETVTYTAVDTTDNVTVNQTAKVTFTSSGTGSGNGTGTVTGTGTGTDTGTSGTTVTTSPDGTQSVSVTSSTSTAQTNVTSSQSLSISVGGGVAQLQMDSGTIPASTGSDSSGSASSTPANISVQLAVLSLTNLPGLSGGNSGTQTTAPQPLPTVLKPQLAVDILATLQSVVTGTTGSGTTSSGTSSSGQAIHQLTKPVTVSFNVSPSILATAKTVVVAYYNPTLGIWVLLPTKVDPTTGKVSTTISHFTTFAVFTSDTATSTLTAVPSGTVNSPLVSISGTSVVGTTISVYDNGALVQSLPLTGASGWSIPVQLQPGVNALTVVANQASGQVGIGESTVTYNAPASGTGTSTGSSSGSGVSTGGSASTPVSFPDLADYGWAQPAILDLAAKGIMSDYNGLFHPEYLVSRAEFVDTLVKALSLKGNATLTFSDQADIPDALQKSVTIAVANGLLSGFPDGTLRPRDVLTRAQAAVLLARALKLVPVVGAAQNLQFADADTLPAWAMDSIAQVSTAGLMRGYTDGAFHPTDRLIRAQVAVLIERYLQVRK